MTHLCRPLVCSHSTVTLMLVLAACGGEGTDGRGTRWQAATDTVGDTIRVRTLSGRVWGDTARLVAEVSIGDMDGPDEYVFGDPSVLEVMEDGTVLVLDYQVPAVRAYASDGSYLRTIGGKGSGPGEYASPDGIGVLNDGRILVRDPPNARISVFNIEGESLGQWFLAGGVQLRGPPGHRRGGKQLRHHPPGAGHRTLGLALRRHPV